MQKTVEEIAGLIQGRVVGDGSIPILGITNIESPAPGLITFVQDEKGLKKLEQTGIACLIVGPALQSSLKPCIQVKDPKRAWAQLLAEFYPVPNFLKRFH